MQQSLLSFLVQIPTLRTPQQTQPPPQPPQTPGQPPSTHRAVLQGDVEGGIEGDTGFPHGAADYVGVELSLVQLHGTAQQLLVDDEGHHVLACPENWVKKPPSKYQIWGMGGDV